MASSGIYLVLSAALVGCAGANSKPIEAKPVVSAAPAPTGAEAPPPAETADASTHAVAEVAPEVPDAASPACVPRGPALSMPICPDPRLDTLLADYEKADRDLSGVVHCEPLSVADLESVKPSKGRVGDASAPPGFFGGDDVDGDGKPDLVRSYTSVDYWGWLLFVRDKTCFRFVSAVEGYQVELLASKHHGARDARVFTYPLQGKVEVRRFDGKEYAP